MPKKTPSVVGVPLNMVVDLSHHNGRDHIFSETRSALALAAAAALMFVASVQGQADQPPQQHALTVVFSGRQLGYFRMPDQQLWTARGCPDKDLDPDQSPEVVAFPKA